MLIYMLKYAKNRISKDLNNLKLHTFNTDSFFYEFVLKKS